MKPALAMATTALAAALPDKLTTVNRAEFEDTCQRRFFFGPSNDPYPATAGLFDFGPVMTAMKVNFLDIWRRHFIVPEGICEVDLPAVTPEQVFIASGHVERFADTIAKDSVTGEPFRLDKLIEDWCEERLKDKKTPADALGPIQQLAKDAGSLNTEALAAAVKKFNILSPKGNPLTEAVPFNLMFKSNIGPEGNKVGYLRPELAQGIILNFKRLVDTGHAQRMPFGAACVGQAYRNEIAPRAALLRVREFTLAEIEWFVHPEDKTHPKIAAVRDVAIWAWDKDQQYEGQVPTRRTIGELLDTGKMKNQTLAYFLARTALFLERVGITQYRFRQHRNDPVAREMAHYAQDCWDAECLTTYGWVECVGIADRSAYDLSAHIEHSKKELTARVDFPEPKVVSKFLGKVDKAKCPKALGKNTGHFFAYVAALSNEQAKAFNEALNAGPVSLKNDLQEDYTVTRELVTFEEKDVKETGYNYVPSVVEPSFGVGRLLYALLEQNYWVRRDDSGKNDKRAVFSFKSALAAYKVAVLPLMVKPVAMEKVARIMSEFGELAVSARTDDSGSAIGKKYARVDELGIPFAVTCDFEEDNCVTLRERDSAQQVRIPIGEVATVVHDLCKPVNPRSWQSVVEKFPAQTSSS